MVAGNVETSTCITNALYGALGVMAAGQCTMNNFTFGNERHQYYETISGGSGAGDGFDGTSVVQTHMTNSRLTDPEVLEFRFPVRLDSYAIRAGSGGAGRWHGGDGGVRRVRFLEPMTASILSNGRACTAPSAWPAAQPGALGINRVERADGRVETLDHIGSTEMEPGDVFVIETPGGGGYGAREATAPRRRLAVPPSTRRRRRTAKLRHEPPSLLAVSFVLALAAALTLAGLVRGAAGADNALAPFGASAPRRRRPGTCPGPAAAGSEAAARVSRWSTSTASAPSRSRPTSRTRTWSIPLEPGVAAMHLAGNGASRSRSQTSDLRSRSGDDTAIKVCVFFDMPIDNMSFTDRQLLRLARSKTSDFQPTATICYVWDAQLPAGTTLDNAFTRRVRYIVLESGKHRLDRWVAEKRDVGADFLKLFGDESKTVPAGRSASSVGADADNTKGHSGLVRAAASSSSPEPRCGTPRRRRYSCGRKSIMIARRHPAVDVARQHLGLVDRAQHRLVPGRRAAALRRGGG